MRKDWLWMSNTRGGKCGDHFYEVSTSQVLFLSSRNCLHAVLLKHTASPLSPGGSCSGSWQITIAAFSSSGFFTSSSSSRWWASSARYCGGHYSWYTSHSITAYSVLLIGPIPCIGQTIQNLLPDVDVEFDGSILSKQNKLRACFPWESHPRRSLWPDSRCGAL